MSAAPPETPARSRRVLVLGGTGTIGRATVAALLRRGNEVMCFLRPSPDADPRRGLPEAARLRFGDVTSEASLRRDAVAGERFDAVVSCLASRSGVARDAWAIDHGAHMAALSVAKEAGIGHFVLLSAICVQKPRLAFQHAKLAFEQALIDSGLTWSIIRPTAYFKSLSGQLDRLRAGKPFLLFGDGRLTACKPISDGDLADYLAGCLDASEFRNRVLPVGGPGPAITPREQGEMLFEALGQRPRFRSVPVVMLDAITAGLGAAGAVSPAMRAKAELARIGRYYATESMLVLDPETGLYDADTTPETGTETLRDFYVRLVRGEVQIDRGAHAVF